MNSLPVEAAGGSLLFERFAEAAAMSSAEASNGDDEQVSKNSQG